MSVMYRSIADMNNCILRCLDKFPHDVDLIVGVPRSGMLPANLLALYLNKPYTDIDSFVEGRIYGCGERGNFINDNKSKKVIVMDDSYCSGNAYRKARKKIESAVQMEGCSITYGVVFTTSAGKDVVDYWCEEINDFRVFQWNLFHHKGIIGKSCFDIDGVLCPNPPVDDDGPLYLEYVKNAPSLYIPSLEIDTLVSCRLEKYREETEKWLAAHNVHYKKLVMLNLRSKEERLRWGKHGEFKADIYKKSSNVLFVESSLAEALVIKQKSHKDVFCIETFEMINADDFSDKRHRFFQKCKRRFLKMLGVKI